MSQLAVLQRCPGQVSSILRRGGSLLLAAKVLVLSRLLHRKASTNSEATVFVEKTRARLGKLRQKLLATVDRRIANLELDGPKLIDALCAFSLVTNSSCSDILRHFHHIRLNAISSTFQVAAAGSSGVVQSLNVFICTVEQTQSLFPRQVSTALSKLKSKPLLKDDGLRDGEDINLNIHENWVDEEIKNFTPYIRHDDLNISAAAQSLSIWTSKALSSYTEGLEKALSMVERFQDVLTLRKECLQLWLNCKGRLVGTSKSETLDSLRQVFQNRLDALLRISAQAIEAISEKIGEAVLARESHQPNATSPVLWRDDLTKTDTVREAQHFTNTVNSVFHGRSGELSGITKVYTRWRDDLDTIREAVTSMQITKWEFDDFDEDEDADNFEDVEDMRHRLEKEDVQDLERAYSDSVTKAICQLESSIANQSREQSITGTLILLLRVTRELKEKLPQGIDSLSVRFSYVPELHSALAHQVTEQSRHVLGGTQMGISLSGRLLWDGTPELPTVPSPWTYRYLKDVQKVLSDIGSDIWTKSAIQELKKTTRSMLAEQISLPNKEAIYDTVRQRNGVNPPESIVNGDHPGEDTDQKPTNEGESIQESRIQLLFDLLYLGEAFSTPGASDDSFHSYCMRIQSDVGLTAELIRRLQGASKAYWKRTCLIFGLLAQA